MASSEGGMDIEEVAASSPEKIHKVYIDPMAGLSAAEAKEVAYKIGVPAAAGAACAELLHGEPVGLSEAAQFGPSDSGEPFAVALDCGHSSVELGHVPFDGAKLALLTLQLVDRRDVSD